MKKNPPPKTANQGAQCKISDSNSWIVSLQHYMPQNTLGPSYKKNQSKQKQYAIASTFDGWVSINSIDVKGIKWQKIYVMKMTMPVINSYIEFNDKFEPQGIVLAYFDGSIDYSPWSKIQKQYQVEIQAGKRRSITKSIPQIIRQTSRPAFINSIIDESQSVEETFMLQTACFLKKKGEYIYLINFKGELKIFRMRDNQSTIQLISKIDLQNRVIKAQDLFVLNEAQKDSILIAICFVDVPIPIIIQLSPKTTQKQIQQRIQFIFQKHLANGDISTKDISQIKLITYDPSTKIIITCNENNRIQIYSFDKQTYTQKDYLFIVNIEKAFYINYKDKVQIINDLSVQQNKLLIICKHSFSIFDLKEDFMFLQSQKLREQAQIGKLVDPYSLKEKPLLLIKKKFNYEDPQVRKSTTLHLFIGR